MYRIFQWKIDDRTDKDDQAIALLDKAPKSESGLANAFYGFVGFAQDGLAHVLWAFLAGAGFVAVGFLVGCFYLAIGHHLGFLTVRDLGLPSWAIVAAHVTTVAFLVLCSQFWCWPAAIKRRGELFKQEQKKEKRLVEIRQRLAERGAYSDSARNVQASQE